MTTVHPALRYTARGGAGVERRIDEMVARASGLVRASFPESDVRALLLLGGYGRGEGGVAREGGEERPHNNLDFLLVSTLRALPRRAAHKRRLDEVLSPIARESGVGIDTGVVGDIELRHAPRRVMWFDLRWGHRTLLGDAAFIPSLPSFPASALDPEDVRDLLVNRASLLCIDAAVLSRGALSEEAARFVVKHAMKAIIGYGDALLFAHGRYHASYVEKQRRMRALDAAPAALRALYEEAAEFRFAPSYAPYLCRDLAAWISGLCHALSPTHLAFERARLGAPDLTFRGYAEQALLAALRPPRLSLRAFGARAKHLARSLRGDAPRARRSPLLGFAARAAGPRALLAATLPTVLYGAEEARDAEIAMALLDAEDTSPAALRRAYLARWGAHGDPNFPTTAARLGLDRKEDAS